ncbi:ATP-binding Cassette (ABC) Superfamily [Achlya hypogyna]|uniref:ATP-binding Cassette (ABC) Superfamily n=1 Tax=Achlya hypogyna TaxID=1202772 RepID=A0A1V9YFQ3_ACHHY|nr:ATP-binding Cassette (ABC) Superfamily [Achlya hypogyna]
MHGIKSPTSIKSPHHFIEVQTPVAAYEEARTGADLLVDVPKMTLEWKHVSRSVQVKNATTKQMDTKVILNDLCGTASPGELVVLMGPSGAGKSSLLDVISGRQKNYTGSVLVNGQSWNKHTTKKASYVMQDDIFYATLTVREHLAFQAELRMGKLFTRAEQRQRVDYVIDELGLTKCQDTQIGGLRLRGISGGERKRLSFATEILTNPSLLFVDEPTSGLDSFMAESVVNQLQALARKGRTVVATIHQPSSELFVLFDKLYLLSDGQPVYNGKASEAVEYFSAQGLQCPTYSNPTDYFMRQIIVLDPASEAATRVQGLVQRWRSQEASSERSSDASGGIEGDDGFVETHLGVVGQMRVLCKRNVTRIVRDKFAFGARLAQTLIISVIVGLIFLNLGVTQSGVQSFTGAIFFIVINQFFSAASPEFLAVPLELPIMTREYSSGLYRVWVWYLAKNLSELFFQVFFPLIFLLPSYFMVGFGPSDAELFFSFYVFIVLLTSSAVGLGYMVSCLSRSPDVAPILGILIILPFVLFGGLFLSLDDVPSYLKWFAYVSPLKYAFRGMSRAFWTTVATIPCDTTKETCVATSGVGVLAHLGLDSETMGFDVAYLVWINLLFRIIGLAALRFKLRQLS